MLAVPQVQRCSQRLRREQQLGRAVASADRPAGRPSPIGQEASYPSQFRNLTAHEQELRLTANTITCSAAKRQNAAKAQTQSVDLTHDTGRVAPVGSGCHQCMRDEEPVA